jgi:microcystin-dependent protein
VVGIGVPGWDVQTKSGRVGEVVFVAASTAKDGTLACDGQAVSRTTYANLYAFALSSGLMAVDLADKTANPAKYGPGDGSTTFQLPDLRDRGLIARGATFAIGATGGSKDAVVVAHNHTGTTDAGGVHSHAMNGGYLKNLGSGGGIASGGGVQVGYETDSGGNHSHTFTTNSTGSSGTNANMQPYAALLACIYY